MKENSIHMPGLNGLRAIAALSVLIAHVSLKGIADFGLPYLFDLPMAGYGVTLFFVISGFLITYLLLQEQGKTQTVDVRKFYIRRILRIWPVYYLFLSVCIVVFFILSEQRTILVKEMWFYVFFAANIPFIFQNGILILVHYWSIGVEEQFYLIWPWIVKSMKISLLRVALIIFILLFLMKLVLWMTLGTTFLAYRFITVTRFHCMMVGAIGAILFHSENTLFIKLATNRIIQLGSWLLFFTVGFNLLSIPAVIGHELIAFASLSMIMGQITVNRRIVNLENLFFDFIGQISYGIYVIHPLIIFLLSKVYRDINIAPALKYGLVYSSVIISTVMIAWLSYIYLEKPFLKFKTRFAVVKSSNSMS